MVNVAKYTIANECLGKDIWKDLCIIYGYLDEPPNGYNIYKVYVLYMDICVSEKGNA